MQHVKIQSPSAGRRATDDSDGEVVNEVRCVSVSPDSRYFAVGGGDCQVYVYDLFGPAPGGSRRTVAVPMAAPCCCCKRAPPSLGSGAPARNHRARAIAVCSDHTAPIDFLEFGAAKPRFPPAFPCVCAPSRGVACSCDPYGESRLQL